MIKKGYRLVSVEEIKPLTSFGGEVKEEENLC